MKKLLVPEYAMSAMRSKAAAECSTGKETRFSTLLTMTASLKLQSPDWHNGSNKPCGAQLNSQQTA